MMYAHICITDLIVTVFGMSYCNKLLFNFQVTSVEQIGEGTGETSQHRDTYEIMYDRINRLFVVFVLFCLFCICISLNESSISYFHTSCSYSN